MGAEVNNAISASESYKVKNDGCKPTLRHPAFLAGRTLPSRTLNRRMGLATKGTSPVIFSSIDRQRLP